MSVKVYATQVAASVHTYETGSDVRLEAGHLVVTGKDSGDVLAVYSPGNWHHADVDDKTV